MTSRRTFLKQVSLLGTIPWIGNMHFADQTISVRLLRHATLVVQVGNVRILVDPMLCSKEAMEPVGNAGNSQRIPMVDLPLSDAELDELIRSVDAVLVTHTHRDHWDAVARERIPKNKLLFCQPSDESTIRGQGFSNVTPIQDKLTWKDVTLHRTSGQHGIGEIGAKMGVVSGFVLYFKQHRLYIAGDTIWCDEVIEALTKHSPTITVVNAGAAQFLTGGPITMTPEEVMKVHQFNPSMRVVSVHMDTVNHCLSRREDLKQYALTQNYGDLVIPADGEEISL
jgi:L-ascorbate metabolism protein UlaG (beta-lactamase superfamily)